jgi:hypothetical protein
MQAGVFLKLWQVGAEQFEELQGIDWGWLSTDGAKAKAAWGEKKPSQSPTGRRKRRRKHRRLSLKPGVPIGLATEDAKHGEMTLVQPTSEAIVVPPACAEQQPSLWQASGDETEEKRGRLDEFGFLARREEKQRIKTRPVCGSAMPFGSGKKHEELAGFKVSSEQFGAKSEQHSH